MSATHTIIEFTLPEIPLPPQIPLPQQMEVLGYQISTAYILIAAFLLALLILTLIVRAIRRRTRPVISAAEGMSIPQPAGKSTPKHMKK